mmetsp:Transcript_14694/g.40628  ORF Transcript_14694/g.40628 Transcript_14694/m.40628 type:complete len:486 (+) Transcript_14694:434-1891(+)
MMTMPLTLAPYRLQAWMLLLALAFLLPAMGQDVGLTASSQFNMVLSPVSSQLDASEMEIVESGIGTVLMTFLEEDTGFVFLDMEAVVQDSELFNATNRAVSSSKLRFFVLVTTAPEDESPRLKLNELIRDAFIDSNVGVRRMTDFLHASGRPPLVNVDSVDVAALVQDPTSTEDDPEADSTSNPSSKRLSTLDILLIVMSGLIFLGILYMIAQHHYDRGYIDNQRILAANRPIRDTSAANEEDSTPRSIHILPKYGIYDSENTGRSSDDLGEAPSTPSTIHSSEFPRIMSPPDFPRSKHARTREKKRLEGTASRDASTSSTLGGASEYSTTESFDSKSWFESSVFSEVKSQCSKKSNKKKADDSELSSNNTSDAASNASEESDDLFLVDVESSTSVLVEKQAKNNGGKAAISDWMKSIRVVSSPCKTSEMTQSSNEGAASSSTGGPSLTMTPPEDCATLEQRSLEHSMASSSPDAPRPRPKFVEV